MKCVEWPTGQRRVFKKEKQWKVNKQPNLQRKHRHNGGWDSKGDAVYCVDIML